jgi:hypothetical protein
MTTLEAMGQVMTDHQEKWEQCRLQPHLLGWFTAKVMMLKDGQSDHDLVHFAFEQIMRAETAERRLKALEDGK